jgi:nucleoside-diphosphate-sugar epimerase
MLTAAPGYGHAQRDAAFTEEDWTDMDNPARPTAPYPKSKTIAERAAWDWIAKEGGDLELAVVNPVGIFGPILSKDYATSIELVSRLMNGQIPGLPNLGFSVVDVRDVADLHLKAMVDPKAAGQRLIAVSDEEFLWTKDIALTIKQRLGDKAKRVPTRSVPDFVMRLVALFDSSVAMIVPELGQAKKFTNQKAKSMLGWQPRSAEEALVASAESMIEQGLVKS